jgi:hypothetical protein
MAGLHWNVGNSWNAGRQDLIYISNDRICGTAKINHGAVYLHHHIQLCYSGLYIVII